MRVCEMRNTDSGFAQLCNDFMTIALCRDAKFRVSTFIF